MGIFDWGTGKKPQSGDRRKGKRRSEKERRSYAGSFRGTDMRLGERRRVLERRGWEFGLVFKTSGSVNKIQDWLDQNCLGECGLTLQGMTDDLSQKSYLVVFEFEKDKIEFVAYFSGQ